MAEEKGKPKLITVTHLNIRPSITLLIGQLVFVNLVGSIVVIVGYIFILRYAAAVNTILKSYFGLILLVIVFATEILLTIFATLQWINDYYELTPDKVIHRKGLIFRKIEKYSLENLMYLSIQQGLLGTLLNYGTLTFLSPRREKLLELYDIHNPNKYMEVLEYLKPNFGRVEEIIRGEIPEKEFYDTDEQEESDPDEE